MGLAGGGARGGADRSLQKGVPMLHAEFLWRRFCATLARKMGKYAVFVANVARNRAFGGIGLQYWHNPPHTTAAAQRRHTPPTAQHHQTPPPPHSATTKHSATTHHPPHATRVGRQTRTSDEKIVDKFISNEDKALYSLSKSLYSPSKPLFP